MELFPPQTTRKRNKEMKKEKQEASVRRTRLKSF